MEIKTIIINKDDNINDSIEGLKLKISNNLLKKAEFLKKIYGKILFVIYENEVINVIYENQKIELYSDKTKIATLFDINEAKKYCSENKDIITRIRYYLDGKLLEDCEPSVLFNI